RLRIARAARRIAAVLGALAIGSCGSDKAGGTTEPEPASVMEISLAPVELALLAGDSRTLTASVKSVGVPPSGGWKLTWASASPAIATVSEGVVTAVAEGTTTITAASGGKTGVTTVTVAPVPSVADIVLDVAALTLTSGQLGALTATLTTKGAIPVGGWPVSWESSNPAVATLYPGGAVLAFSTQALGATTITAKAGGKTASAIVTVAASNTALPPDIMSVAILPSEPVFAPATLTTIDAIVTTAATPPPTGFPVVWTSSDPTVAAFPAIASSQLQVDAKKEGKTTITASYGGKTGTTTLYVATPTSIVVTPMTQQLAVGQQVKLAPVVTSTGPLPATGWPVTYTIGSTLTATVNASGVVTGVGAGTTRLYANAPPKQTTVIVTVTGPGLTVGLTGDTTMQGTLTQSGGMQELACLNPLTLGASGAGTALFGNQEMAYDSGPFREYVGVSVKYRTLAAGATLGWRVLASESFTSAALVRDFTVTTRVHYGVNTSVQDYPAVSPDYTSTHTFTCKVP
ncbi:MAG: Ig domain-containing protein, partial [Gemmatimonadaceae bacterium]